MRIPHRILCLLILGVGLVGCSQTGGFRAVTPSDVKTTASVGDRPLPVVAGLAGDERAETVLPDPPRTTSRISGRVYDADGQPARNAVVRLALTGAAGGKVVHATTDRSGAFTLRGVRPGSSYTVIAEYQGEQGMMTGRAAAEAPDTDVRISLHPRDAATGDDVEVAAAPENARVKSVGRTEEKDGAAEPEDADLVEPRTAASPNSVRPRLETLPEDLDEPTPAWSSKAARPRTPPADAADDEPADSQDDGDNPLPPAREISKVSARSDELPPADEPDASLDGEPPHSLPDGVIEGGRGQRFGPVILDDAEPAEEARPKPRAGSRSSRRPANADVPTAEKARPTWSDVLSSNDSIPVDEALAQTQATVVATARAAKAAPVVASAATTARTSKAAAAKVERTTPYCDYDPDERRITDFALYDTSGKLVSIRDFDADLILLDFWGTWCLPCRTSIPHLSEIQARLGGKKIQVVSVAYERTKEPERAAKVKEVADGLKINYPVLVVGMDDACPVREALQVWFYPTMILIDREGRILRREQGATAATLANIDRAIAEHLDDGSRATVARREPKGRATR
ncbi:redoxin domain-containing protein [Paludisphaera mucosa]|uniref:Carboxypeptidase regulatory-like domain-containing protein n=1 Tax=Paludisphaera mucosa TaxID=3030827 RepID=A0ABT6F7Y4_9BACT|nr:redoxin domain-containing protein [Paludisphaera mucosa]MDG3003698.1 carboxypeptidase regulatory-like domain-containing protein [Paludisphaera mucosa]